MEEIKTKRIHLASQKLAASIERHKGRAAKIKKAKESIRLRCSQCETKAATAKKKLAAAAQKNEPSRQKTEHVKFFAAKLQEKIKALQAQKTKVKKLEKTQHSLLSRLEKKQARLKKLSEREKTLKITSAENKEATEEEEIIENAAGKLTLEQPGNIVSLQQSGTRYVPSTPELVPRTNPYGGYGREINNAHELIFTVQPNTLQQEFSERESGSNAEQRRLSHLFEALKEIESWNRAGRSGMELKFTLAGREAELLVESTGAGEVKISLIASGKRDTATLRARYSDLKKALSEKGIRVSELVVAQRGIKA